MPKVLVIGWDAADWKVIHQLVDEGKMPHTKQLMEDGVMANLATLHPVLSPMLWTSIATGKRPFKHGILGFSEPTPDGAAVQPVTQLSRTTKAIWNILNQQGLRSNVVGWWPSHPVEPINGVMVSNHYQTAAGPLGQAWNMGAGTVHPPELAKTFAELRLHPNELVPEQLIPFIPDAEQIDQEQDKRLASVMKILAECSSVHAAATWAMEHQPWDFMGVYYDAIDHFCHGFMKYHPPRRPHISEDDFERYKGVVEAGYRFHDMMLGSMLALAPADTTVIICSDHGFHPDHLRPTQLPNEPAGPAIEHRDLGMLLMAGPGIRKDAHIHGARLLDITPTILTLFGLPVGEDMDGRVLLDAFEQPPEVTTIPSWDDVPGDDARLAEEQCFDPLAAKEAMDQLVALGYIEPLAENASAAVEATARELRYNLARAYMDADQYQQAVPILDKLYREQPDQFRFGVQLALCYRALRQVTALRELVESMSKARREAADKASVELLQRQQELREQQRSDGTIGADDDIDYKALSEVDGKAVNDLQLVARFSLHDLEYLMGWVLTAEGKPEGALEHLRRAARSPQQRPGLHIQIGETLISLRRWPEALKAFQRAATIDPLNPHAHYGLAQCHLAQRNNDQAINEALQTIGLFYHYPLAHYLLGLALIREQQFLRAAEALDVAISINPNFQRAHRVSAWLHRHWLGDLEKAAEHRSLAREIRAANRKQRQASTTAPPPAVQADHFSEDKLLNGAKVPDNPGEYITVVSGLPRSGTSMAMQMLAAGGRPALTDGQRQADSDNPKGYFELTRATRLRNDHDWLSEAHGQSIKLVAQLLPFIPTDQPCRVIFMERDIDEVLASQGRMLKNLGRPPADDEKLRSAFNRQLRQLKVSLAARATISVRFIRHSEAINDPSGTAAAINAFLGGGLDEQAMAAAVDPDLYRQRAAPAAEIGSEG